MIIPTLLIISLLFLILSGKTKTKKVLVAGRPLIVEVADTPQKREQGLSGREKMCSDCGMLFVFDQPGIYPFWMKEMYFDIDILWIIDDKVADITFGAKVPPKEEFSAPKIIYQSKSPINSVLEVNAGWVEKNGIEVGDVVKFD